MKSVRVGVLGAAGYTGGELIRVLLGHPQVEIVFANSESNAGNPVSEVHEGLIGETDLKFTDEMPFDIGCSCYPAFAFGPACRLTPLWRENCQGKGRHLDERQHHAD